MMFELVPPSPSNRKRRSEYWASTISDVPHDAAIVRVVVPVRVAAIDLAVRIDHEALDPGVVGPGARVVQEAALDRVIPGHGAGQLDLAALVHVVGRQHDTGRGSVAVPSTDA